MMTSSRLRDTGESFSNRRGHGSQLSISDPSHHVTEAIGTLYGDSDDESGLESRRYSRPLSFVASPYGGEQIHKSFLQQLSPQPQTSIQTQDFFKPDEHRVISRALSDMTLPAVTTGDPLTAVGNGGLKNSQTPSVRKTNERGDSSVESFLPPLQPSSPLSPTLSLREVQTESQGASQFPLTNIDNPNDIAQELSNLQALRRMSMDVGNSADPDLVPFQGLSLMAMPSIAPTGEDVEGDISRLLWVPAKVHPELAPDQFKNFLEKRVQSIKRRSGESLLAADGQLKVDGGLGRKKSMLSRQVASKTIEENNLGGVGGAHDDAVSGDWLLQRRRSQPTIANSSPELSLNELVRDPSKIVQRLALDTQRTDGLERPSTDEDKPILPAPTMGLRRSTRTTYRKGGSLRSGDRVPFSKRPVGARQVKKDSDKDSEESGDPQPPGNIEHLHGHSLQRANSEPLAPENFSRPVRPAIRRQHRLPQDGHDINGTFDEQSPSSASSGLASTTSQTADHTSSFPQRSSSQSEVYQDPVPTNLSLDTQQHCLDDNSLHKQLRQQPPPRSSKRPSFGKAASTTSTPQTTSQVEAATSQTLAEVARQPSDLLGGGFSRTDSLTIVPTLAPDERKTEKKPREKDETDSGKSVGWKWFKSDDREKKKKEKEREREREKEDHAKKLRTKIDRSQTDKVHDGARLDVLQSSIDNSIAKGRESFLLDRDNTSARLPDEKKVESNNRKAAEPKREKDGFFGSIFGGSRRKESKDGGGNKGKQRISSPEPVIQLLRPDIDYPYTRFPIVEERAIYRMAHIKLANPRRDLRSQVLLSNFMYSYLAKVQAMHPQLNVPTSPHQKRQEEERRRREQEQQQQQFLEQQMFQHQQSPQGGIDQYNFEYHKSANKRGNSAEHTSGEGAVEYVDDAQIYEYDHGGHRDNASMGTSPQPHQPHQQSPEHFQNVQHEEQTEAYRGRDSNRSGQGYYEYGNAGKSHESEDDMW